MFEYAGTVSSGTMRSEDLILKFLNILEDLSPARAHSLTSAPSPEQKEVLDLLKAGEDPLPSELDDHASDMVSWLFIQLDMCAPEGYRFGAHEGDGADYGFWEVTDD